MKTDGLKWPGQMIETVDHQNGVIRFWRVVDHQYVAYVGRVCEMVTLEAERSLVQQESPK